MMGMERGKRSVPKKSQFLQLNTSTIGFCQLLGTNKETNSKKRKRCNTKCVFFIDETLDTLKFERND
jgi:hypothetical protein